MTADRDPVTGLAPGRRGLDGGYVLVNVEHARSHALRSERFVDREHAGAWLVDFPAPTWRMTAFEIRDGQTVSLGRADLAPKLSAFTLRVEQALIRACNESEERRQWREVTTAQVSRIVYEAKPWVKTWAARNAAVASALDALTRAGRAHRVLTWSGMDDRWTTR